VVVFAFMVLLTPPYAFPAERDGTGLFFSFADLKTALTRPSPSHWDPSFSWCSRQAQRTRESPIEQNYRGGHGLGFDNYTRPGTCPRWGYEPRSVE
jgi:hypothetical protein